MGLSRRQRNRAALARQHLLSRVSLPAAQAVRSVLAIQAQEPASVHLALWARVDGLDADAVDEALRSAELVRATLMRGTLHVVHADDHPMAHSALTPTLRAARFNDRRFRGTGVTADEADGVLDELLEWAAVEPRTNAEAEEWLAARGLGDPMVWWALRYTAPLRRAVDPDAPWSFSTSLATHVTAAAVARAAPAGGAPDDALGTLVERHLAAFGPGTVGDVSRFAMVPKGRLRPVVAGIRDRLVEHRTVDGDPLLDVPGASLPDEDEVAPPRLLPMWDSVLFAHEDRSWIVDDDVRALVIRRNGDTLPTVLVDGRVVGVWRLAPDAEGVELTLLRPVGDEDLAGLAAEARSLLAFVGDRDPSLYTRYRRWWDRLPAEAATVVLPDPG